MGNCTDGEVDTAANRELIVDEDLDNAINIKKAEDVELSFDSIKEHLEKFQAQRKLFGVLLEDPTDAAE